MLEGKQGTMHVDMNGQRCHVCYQPVPGTDWSLALVCPDNEVLRDYHLLAYVVIGLIGIGMLIILWLCNRVVRHTISPINWLLDSTRHIAEGNYEETIPRSNKNDSIGQLQDSFVAMQEALQSHMGSIHKTAEEIRKRNEERAHEMELAEKAIRKKNVFIQNLSHQIRTPLNIIVGFTNVMHDHIALRSSDKTKYKTFLKENQSDIVNMMKYNSIHLNRMVLMLFDSSNAGISEKLMGNRKDEVSCNDVARECIDYTKKHFQGLKIKLETELPDSVYILTNHLYLMRTIRELLYNAAKYSDGKNISLYVSQTVTTIRFTVQDTGPGLPDNADELIFKPFIKIDDLSEGLGLGLPLSKRHALSLGGELIYDKDYHDGCRFIVEMPK